VPVSNSSLLSFSRSALNTAPSRTALILAFTAIYLIWGSTYLGIRIAIETMPPFLMAAARFLIAGTVLFVFLKLRGAAWPTAYQWRVNAIIGGFSLIGVHFIFIPARTAGAVVALHAIWQLTNKTTFNA